MARMLSTVALLAFGAVSGTPEPQPGDNGEDGVLVTWGNDAFGVPPGPDDHRTNQLTVWARMNDFQLVLDDSMLTDRDNGRRTDEWTVTLGYRLTPELTVGASGRLLAATSGQVVVAFSRAVGAKSAGDLIDVEIANSYAKA